MIGALGLRRTETAVYEHFKRSVMGEEIEWEANRHCRYGAPHPLTWYSASELCELHAFCHSSSVRR